MKTLPKTAVMLAGAYMALLLCSHLIRHMELDDRLCTHADGTSCTAASPCSSYDFTCEPRAWYLP